MRPWILGIWTAAAMTLAGCSAMPPPVPLIGSPGDVARLEGEWSGEYHSGETQRSGSITFALSAGADTAFGDVLMLPRQRAQGRPSETSRPEVARPPQTLPIRFVVAEGERLIGLLEPYDDPDCGCLLATRFEGRIRGDVIEGVYTSTNTVTGQVTRGEWKVKRSRDRTPSASAIEEGRR